MPHSLEVQRVFLGTVNRRKNFEELVTAVPLRSVCLCLSGHGRSCTSGFEGHEVRKHTGMSRKLQGGVPQVLRRGGVPLQNCLSDTCY